MRAVLLVVAGCGRMHFDPLGEGGQGGGDGSIGDGGATRVLYAATVTELFRIDPVTLVRVPVRPLCPELGSLQTADIAMSSANQLYATVLTSTAFYRVGTDSKCTLIANLTARQTALEFMPAGVIGPVEVLVGAGDDNALYRIDPSNGAQQSIGFIGGTPAGDLTWTGTEALLTTQGLPNNYLSRVNLTTGAATSIGDTTFNQVPGLAWFGGELFGFTNDGSIAVFDPATGAPTRTASTPESWAGATTGL